MSKRLTDSDGEVRELTSEDMQRMRPLSELAAELQPAMLQRGQRGPQHTPTKVKTTMRLSPEVVEHFKAQGPGWQRRIDQVLREHIREHEHE